MMIWRIFSCFMDLTPQFRTFKGLLLQGKERKWHARPLPAQPPSVHLAVGVLSSLPCGPPGNGMSILWMLFQAEGHLIVDDPEGKRSNLGGSLWHYRHNRELIRAFHAYLKKEGLEPSDLPLAARPPP